MTKGNAAIQKEGRIQKGAAARNQTVSRNDECGGDRRKLMDFLQTLNGLIQRDFARNKGAGHIIDGADFFKILNRGF